MRHATGGIWTLQLMIIFIILFVGYIILTLNYSRTIKIKNEVVSLVEKYDGINKNSINNVNNYLMVNGYSGKGSCYNDDSASNSGIYGAEKIDADNVKLELAQKGKKYYYCIKKYYGIGKTSYYQVSLFYHFTLPILGDSANFTVTGTTGSFQNKDESTYSSSIGG